jgi:4-hydroxybenzoyl-CoA thioesterase
MDFSRSPVSTRKTERDRPFPLPASHLPDDAYSTARIVRFSDCDPAGIVYTPRFIDLVNGVIEDFFQAELQINYHEMIGIKRVGLGYASVDTDFFKPAFMGDRLVFTPLLTHIGRTSAIFLIHCFRGVEEVMRCRLVMVTTSLDTNHAINLPPVLRDALIAYQANCSRGVKRVPLG